MSRVRQYVCVFLAFIILIGACGVSRADAAIEVTLGREITVTPEDDDPMYFSFTPKKTGFYDINLKPSKVPGLAITDPNGTFHLLALDQTFTVRLNGGERGVFSFARANHSKDAYSFTITEAEFGAVRHDNAISESFKFRYGSEQTLKVDAYSSSGGLKYSWYVKNELISSGSPELNIVVEDHTVEYDCVVEDSKGHKETVWFIVRPDSGLKLVGERQRQIVVPYGSDITLEAPFTAYDDSEIEYRWGILDDRMEDVYGFKFEIKNVTTALEVACHAEDQFGLSEGAYFDILVDNELSAKVRGANDNNQLFVADKGKYTVKLDVNARDKDGITVEMGNCADDISKKTDSLEVDMSSGTAKIWYRVTDKYGNTVSDTVEIFVDNDFSISFPKDTITIGTDESYDLTAILKNKKESDVKIRWVICPYIDSKPNEFYAHAIASHSLTATISKPAGMTDKALVKCYVESSSGAVQTACINVIFRDKTDPKSNILAFVERIYTYVLNREPEEDGAAFWSDELWSFRRTGAEVAQGFIFSEEFENRKTTDDEFLTILYRTFFDREPDEGGMDYWRGQLKSGAMDRITVANGFIYSQEWADTCASYGIRSGGDLKPTSRIEPTALTYAFVERMYTTALGRGYDEEGKQYWASCLADFETTGEAVGAFFFLSDEMVSYKLSDEDYLTRLYATFMDREPDKDGMAFWLDFMKANDRQATVLGFTRSPEFTEKCIEARIFPY